MGGVLFNCHERRSNIPLDPTPGLARGCLRSSFPLTALPLLKKFRFAEFLWKGRRFDRAHQ